MRSKLVIILHAGLCVVSTGCATIPPEAAEHADRLAQYHAQTTAGTLGSHDKILKHLDFTITVLGGQVEALWRGYAGDTDTAAKEFKFASERIAQGLSVIDMTDWGDNAQTAEALKTLLTEVLNKLDEQQKSFSGFHQTAMTESQSDIVAIAEYRVASRGAANELRGLIVEHNDTIADGIRLYMELFESYNMVALNRRAFFGAKLESKAEDLEEKAISVVREYSEKIDPLIRALEGFVGSP